jgi:hypothetical protein
MKSNLKILMIWSALSILMAIFWIVGLMIGNSLFPSDIMKAAGNESSGNTDLWLFITCLINTAAVLFFIYNARIKGLKLTSALFLIIFGIQYFMSQIETFWFNDSLKMPLNTIWMVVSGGAIMSILFSITATWLTGKFKKSEQPEVKIPKTEIRSLIKPVVWLAIIVWPLVYFIAGYFIAWQFAAIREYYSGSTEMESLFVMMKENVVSGLYFFQILRGLLWVSIAFLVFISTTGSWMRKGLIMGLLLSCLGCSQLLLPNPIMPEMVRLGHLLETSTSNFIWGFILSWFLARYFSVGNATEVHSKNMIHQTIS